MNTIMTLLVLTSFFGVNAYTPSKSEVQRVMIQELRSWTMEFDERPHHFYLNRTQYSFLLSNEEILQYVMQRDKRYYPVIYIGDRFKRSAANFLRSKWTGKHTQAELDRLIRIQYKFLLNRNEILSIVSWWDRNH